MRYLAYLLLLCTVVLACQQPASTDASHSDSEPPSQASSTHLSSTHSRNIAPPIDGVDVPFETHEFAAEVGSTVTFSDGTVFRVPASAFVDAQGNTYRGDVVLSYRDFRAPAEILASGIPMDVELPDGSLGYMQTAGMFEVRAATVGGSPLDVAADQEIGVDMPSNVDGNQYDFWSYDEAANQWDNEQPNVAATGNPERTIARKLIASPAPREVPPAATFDKRKPIVDLNIDTERFPELRQLDGVFWQYAGSEAAQDPNRQEWVFTEDWNTADIVPGERANTYAVTLQSDDKTFSTTLVPSKTTPELQDQMAAYNTRLAKYKETMLSRAEAQAYLKKQTEFVRSMRIRGMGIYNYDRLLKEEDRIPLLADFEFEEDIRDARDLVQIFLITGDSRMLVKLPPEQWSRFSFSPSMDNRLMAILPGNKVAVFTQADFDRSMQDLRAHYKKAYTFKMRTLPYSVASIDDLSRIIRQIS